MRWDESDIVKRLCRSLDIAKRSVTLFSERGYTDKEVSDNSFRPDKPIAETAMLLYAASRVRHHPEIASRIDDIAQDLAPLARSKRIMLSMTLHPSVCVEFAVPHILLSQIGFKEQRFDRLLRLCLDSQASRGHERPPFASLEKSWILELWNGDTPGLGWHVDLNNSVLNWPIDLLGGLREDAYALTHLVIYCPDYGSDVKCLPRPSSMVRRGAILPCKVSRRGRLRSRR